MRYLRSLNREIAWHATVNLFLVLGFVFTVAWAATLPWWLFLFGGIVVGACWLCLYQVELNIRTRKGAL